MSAVRADSRWRRRSPHRARIRRTRPYGACDTIRMPAIRTLAVAATCQWATGAGTGCRHRARENREVESASGPATGSRSGRSARCALCRSAAAAALTDGRYSGGFKPEATVAARRANPPELSVWCRDASGRRAILRRGVMMAALGALVETHATIGASYRTSMPKYPI